MVGTRPDCASLSPRPSASVGTSGASLLAYPNELIRPGLKEEALSLITGLVVAGHEVGLTHRILQQQAGVGGGVGAAWLPSLWPPQGPQGYGVRPYWSPPPGCHPGLLLLASWSLVWCWELAWMGLSLAQADNF